MLSKNAYPRRKTTKKVPVEKSVENVENSALSTDIPMRPPAARNPENESTGCIFTGTRAAVPGYVAVAFRGKSEKTGKKCWVFFWTDCQEAGPSPNGPKKFVESSQKSGYYGNRPAQRIFFENNLHFRGYYVNLIAYFRMPAERK